MSGANGDALEWAVALLHAPAERHALRLRSLPTGMTALLGVAADALPDALRTAAARFAESEASIRDAARFYVREVLLFPHADAYRVLGVEADAPLADIKAHYRLLQRWLHPDRIQDAGDAVFAVRVNGAWQHLRNAERRAAYNHALAQEKQTQDVAHEHAIASIAEGPQAARVWVPVVQPVPALQRWLKRLPFLVMLLFCVVLSGLIVRDYQRAPGLVSPTFTETKPPLVTRPIAVGALSVKSKPAKETGAGKTPARRLPEASISAVVPAVPTSAAIPVTAQTPMPLPKQLREPDQNAITSSPALAVEPSARNVPLPAIPADILALPDSSQIQSAQQAGGQLLRFMQQPGLPPPPIWNNPTLQTTAIQMRQQLHANGRVTFADPRWRIDDQTAELITRYTGGDGKNTSGVLTATLRWREGQWLVSGLGMGQTQ